MNPKKQTNKSQTRSLYGSTERLFWLALAGIATVFALYVYCISLSISNVVLREEMQLELAATNSRIGELESEYLTKKYAIDMQYAESLGFVALESKHFAVREGSNLTLNQ